MRHRVFSLYRLPTSNTRNPAIVEIAGFSSIHAGLRAFCRYNFLPLSCKKYHIIATFTVLFCKCFASVLQVPPAG
nr:MAG TPA: hypothetical protein [Caudoviricetes sp.]